jgi:hypothetical protein
MALAADLTESPIPNLSVVSAVIQNHDGLSVETRKVHK